MVRNIIGVRVDRAGATKRINRLQRLIVNEGAETVKDVADLGKAFAQRKAPYHSGQTFRSIRVLKAKKATEAIVFAQNILNDGHPRSYAKFDLVRWMHTSRKASRHIHTGDPRFMYTTRDYLKRVATVVGQKRYDRVTVSV